MARAALMVWIVFGGLLAPIGAWALGLVGDASVNKTDLQPNETAEVRVVLSSPLMSAAGDVDLVFVLDESGSVEAPDWERTLSFVGDVINGLPVSAFDNDSIRVAVVAFASRSRVAIPPTSNRESLLASIANLPRDMGSTCHSCAIREASALFEASDRPDAERVVILMTDGDPSGRGETPGVIDAAVRAANDLGVTRHIVGVGDVERAGLERLASAPVDEHIFDADGFNDLTDVLIPIIEAIVAGKGTDITVEALVEVPFRASNAVATHGDVQIGGNTVVWTLPEHSMGDAVLTYDVTLSCQRREMARPIHRKLTYHDAEHAPIVFPALEVRLHGCLDAISLDAANANPAVAEAATYTALAADGHGDPVPDLELLFEVRSGPNAGTLATALTDADGRAEFEYVGAAAGDDVVWVRSLAAVNVASRELTVSWR